MTAIDVIEENTNNTSTIIENMCPICFDINCIPTWKCDQCNAVFHKKCIKKWETANTQYPYYSTCPTCKLKYNLCNGECIARRALIRCPEGNVRKSIIIAYVAVVALLITIIINVVFIVYLFIGYSIKSS